MQSFCIKFVIPQGCLDETETSDIMIETFTLCKENVSTVEWVKEADVLSQDLNKTDFIIFQEFKGDCFESIKEKKCPSILGPLCVLNCLTDGTKIPNFPWPIYNTAMIGCVVSCSFLPKSKKEEIKEKVQTMGGCYSDTSLSTITHLVSESVKSEKYMKAAEAGVKIMLSKWIDDVWKDSQIRKIHCNDDQYEKYKCPPFHNLVISSTGMKIEEQRKTFSKLVQENGGIYSAQLVLAKTDFLVVVGEAGSTSAKFKAARKSNQVECVTMDWIIESINKGYALPSEEYKVQRNGVTSTPTKEGYLNPNFSVMSAVTSDSIMKTLYDETLISAKTAGENTTNKTMSELDELVDKLSVKGAKAAGQFLDGCSVYLAGFDYNQKEKLSKILNMSGATRYEDASDRLTHIIVGNVNSAEVKLVKSKNYPAIMVTPHWLLDSMKAKHPIDEENYSITKVVEQEKVYSPVCRKALNLLRSNKTVIEDKDKTIQEKPIRPLEPEGDILMQQYLNSVNSQNQETDSLAILLKNNSQFNTHQEEEMKEKSMTQYSELSEDLTYFYGLTFLIVTTENQDILKQQIESGKGSVLSKTFKGIPDLLVLPMFIYSPNQLTATEVVNEFWIKECTLESCYCTIQYYHRPILLQKTNPLENCVVTISGYKGYEREFLKLLIEALGGIHQDQFARTTIENSVLASTHLVSSEASGKKYNGALKWGTPVVNKDWLLECAKTGKRIKEDDYLVGESKIEKFNKNFSITTSSTCYDIDKTSVPGCSKNTTPQSKTTNQTKEQTPVNSNRIKNAVDPCSQVTPASKIIKDARLERLLGTPETPPAFKHWTKLDTPETPLGAFIKPNPSPNTKKQWLNYINHYPDFSPPKKRRTSTPLSELKKRLWANLPPRTDSPKPSENESISEQSNETENILVESKLKQLENMLTTNNSAGRKSGRDFQSIAQYSGTTKESQPMTVGWDYLDEDHIVQNKLKIFMISGLDESLRQELLTKLESLNAVLSDLAGYDPTSTHLVCAKMGRNEKTLASMAAGKWILHYSYVIKSAAAGHFLDEEEFELGNPKSLKNLPKESLNSDGECRTQCIYWWRKEIERRGYGAFNDMRAIVIAKKRESLVRVIEAGGGTVIDVNPPFREPVTNATHCLLETRSVMNYEDYVPLVKQGIYCVNTTYISHFLNKTRDDITDYILPPLAKYYKSD